MATVTVSSQISAPLDKVFEMFTDIEHGAENVRTIKSIELMTTGPFQLGTRWREIREIMGRLDDAEMEVTAFERNRTYTITHYKGGLTHSKGGVRIDTVFTFEPADAGTKVSIEFGLNRQGLPPGLLSPIEWAISGKVRDVLSHDLADLKESAELVSRQEHSAAGR